MPLQLEVYTALRLCLSQKTKQFISGTKTGQTTQNRTDYSCLFCTGIVRGFAQKFLDSRRTRLRELAWESRRTMRVSLRRGRASADAWGLPNPRANAMPRSSRWLAFAPPREGGKGWCAWCVPGLILGVSRSLPHSAGHGAAHAGRIHDSRGRVYADRPSLGLDGASVTPVSAPLRGLKSCKFRVPRRDAAGRHIPRPAQVQEARVPPVDPRRAA